MYYVAAVIAFIAGVTLIVAVTLQSAEADGFSAAMGGGDTSRFKKGSKEETLDKLTKVSAIVWLVACLVCAAVWYKSH